MLARLGSSSRGRKGFTLIELLVVIAIIALLIAILLPSLEAARRQAKLNTCLSNIKNIGTSSRVYEADDPQGWGIPVHPGQYEQLADPSNPTFVGAYEWGGKSGIGMTTWSNSRYPNNPLGSKFGTAAGFGPATRPMNEILYKGGFTDHNKAPFNRPGAQQDTKLDLANFRCPADDGPPRGAHCRDWVENPEFTSTSSYDYFGNSYAANIFMISSAGGGPMFSNSPYLRPTTRVPTPARTLYYEENIGRWAWSCRRELPECDFVGAGVNPGPTKAVRGWHGKDWTFNRVFVDAHAETQKVYIEGTEDREGYALHYRNEQLESYPADSSGQPGEFEFFRCIIVRGPSWQKDTMPANLLPTGLIWGGGGRPSYEGCVETD